MCSPDAQQVTKLISYCISAVLTFFGAFLNEIAGHVAEIGIFLGAATYATNAYFLNKNFKLNEQKINAELAELHHRRKCD